MTRETNKQSMLYLTTFLLGLALILTSSVNNKIQELSINQRFGLLGYLPQLFWIGFAIMIASILLGINKDTKKIFFIKSFLLFIIIANIPTLYLENFDATDSIVHFEHSLKVNDMIKTYNWGWDPYPKDWPGFFQIGFYLFKISSLSVFEFLKYYRILSSALTFLALYLLMSRFTKEKEMRYSILISSFTVVWYQFHYSPQSFFLPVTLVIISLFTYKSGLAKIGALVLGLLLIVSHPVNLLILISILFVWLTIQVILKMEYKANLIVYTILIIMVLSWIYLRPVEDFYPSKLFSRYTPVEKDKPVSDVFQGIGGSIDSRFNLEEIKKDEGKYGVYNPYTGDSQYNGDSGDGSKSLLDKLFLQENAMVYSTRIRMIGLLFMSAITLLFILLTIKNKSLDDHSVFLISAMIALFIALELSEILQKSAWQDRFFIYFTITNSIIIPKAIGLIKRESLKTAVIVITVIFIAFQFSTIYSKEFGQIIESPVFYVSDYYISQTSWDTCKSNNLNEPKIEPICRVDNIYLYTAGERYREYYIEYRQDSYTDSGSKIYSNGPANLYIRS